jgi:uncharacterized protein (DUF1810 family)
MASNDHTDHYGLISLGTGEAGKYIAWTIAGTQGKRCATIENKWLGGSCKHIFDKYQEFEVFTDDLQIQAPM